jgi:hypothetical protein
VLSAKGSPLVAGTAQPNMDQPITVKVERGFMFKGAPVLVGMIVTLPAAIAWEVIGMGKAVRYIAPAPEPEPEPAEPEAFEEPPARRGRPPKFKEQES